MTLPFNSHPLWSRGVRLALLTLLATTVCVCAADEPLARYEGPADKLHIYLLIGGEYMAGCTELAQGDGNVIDRCYLFNEEGEWEPAREPLNRFSSISDGEELSKMGRGGDWHGGALWARSHVR